MNKDLNLELAAAPELFAVLAGPSSLRLARAFRLLAGALSLTIVSELVANSVSMALVDQST